MADTVTHSHVERLGRGVALELRQFVREAGTRRALPFTAYLGTPGVTRCLLTHDAVHDPVLRADLVERALDGAAEPAVRAGRVCVWVTRPGDLVTETRDLAWLSAARTGFSRHGLTLPAFFVVGRYGWHEVLTGRTRRWTRIRSPRPGSGAPAPGS